jgi:hypothetical protein
MSLSGISPFLKMLSIRVTLCIKGLILSIIMLALFAGVARADESPQRPHWAVAVKGGLFYPDEDNWDRFYGTSYTGQIGMSLSYKLTRYIEVGVEGSYMQDSGVGYLPINDTTGGDVTIRLYPVNLFVLVRALFEEDQLLVPYIGGGWTNMFYTQRISGQDDVDGHADGYHIRGGLQLLLDTFDRDASQAVTQYGIKNTYLFLEASSIKVEDDDTSSDLGGNSFSLGLMIEF